MKPPPARWSGPVEPSDKKGKKVMRRATLPSGKKIMVYAGAPGYKNNYSDKARKAFWARHQCALSVPGTAKHLACHSLWGRHNAFDHLK